MFKSTALSIAFTCALISFCAPHDSLADEPDTTETTQEDDAVDQRSEVAASDSDTESQAWISIGIGEYLCNQGERIVIGIGEYRMCIVIDL